MQAKARMASVVSSTLHARRRLIRSVLPNPKFPMRWTTISTTLKSSLFWSLGFLLFLVPLLAKAFGAIGPDTKFLYCAALLITVATVVHTITKPPITAAVSYSAYLDGGVTLDSLRAEVIRLLGSLDRISNISARTILQNEGGATNVPQEVFCRGSKRLGHSKTLRTLEHYFSHRIGHRHSYRSQHLPRKSSMERTMKHNSPNAGTYLKAGGAADVTHDTGGAKPTTTSGTILNPDDQGFIVIKDGTGRIHHIPKDRIYDIQTN